ncbi:basic leucine zipper [Anaeramoeba flamelloides]|uniref:Basic leucine zipper n=1 Tax=Anaeramoeba flamelloides TaxID=1746091 RepID=A0AAV7Z3S5_9EUKA|nr:basic leucine zipper [Anaeramoeba flamelloides]
MDPCCFQLSGLGTVKPKLGKYLTAQYPYHVQPVQCCSSMGMITSNVCASSEDFNTCPKCESTTNGGKCNTSSLKESSAYLSKKEKSNLLNCLVQALEIQNTQSPLIKENSNLKLKSIPCLKNIRFEKKEFLARNVNSHLQQLHSAENEKKSPNGKHDEQLYFGEKCDCKFDNFNNLTNNQLVGVLNQRKRFPKERKKASTKKKKYIIKIKKRKGKQSASISNKNPNLTVSTATNTNLKPNTVKICSLKTNFTCGRGCGLVESKKQTNTKLSKNQIKTEKENQSKDPQKKTTRRYRRWSTRAEWSKHRREANRISARRCRARRKQYLTELETELQIHKNGINAITGLINMAKTQNTFSLNEFILNLENTIEQIHKESNGDIKQM